MFCQNYQISREAFGKPISVSRLSEIFLELQEAGAHNINLVTPTQYLPWIVPALDVVRDRLAIPVVYNCGGYERAEVVAALAPYVDIWLPDLKYQDPALSASLSQAPDYFAAAHKAIRQMVLQTGPPELDGDGIMKRGVIIRHLVLPGHRDDSIRLLHWLAGALPKGQYYISLMSQYTPYRKIPDTRSWTGGSPAMNMIRLWRKRCAWDWIWDICRKKAVRRKNTHRRLDCRDYKDTE